MLQFWGALVPFFCQLFGLSALCHGQNLVTEVNHQDLLRICSLGSLQVRLAVLAHIAAGVGINLGTPSDTFMGKWCLAGILGETQQCLCL